MMTRQESAARDIAREIAAVQDTDVTPGDIDAWSVDDVCEWLASWGYEWDGAEWLYQD